MPELDIVTADRGSARRAFLDLPYRLYAQDPVWVAPLRRDQKSVLDARRHPFFRHAELRLLIARRRSAVVGRVAAIVDHDAPSENGRRVGGYGFFECLHDQEAANGLIAAAREWLRGRGCQLMRGPVNPSYNYGCGVLVDGFGDPPVIGTSYNPSYYDNLLVGAGLGKAKDLIAFSLKAEQLVSVRTLAARFASPPPGARLRPFDVHQRERDIRLIWKLHSKGFTKNYDFAPLSLEEVRAIALDIERFGDKRLAQFCEVDGRPAGIAVAFPDWNQALREAHGRLFPLGWWRILRARRRIDRARIWLVAIAPEWQGTGLAGAFLSLAGQPGLDQYTEIEASWIVESHQTMLRALALVGARAYKRYRLYEGNIE
jgi:hypothetical protein